MQEEPNMPASSLSKGDSDMLNDIVKHTFSYFVDHCNPNTGLIADKTTPGSFCSIASLGMGISSYVTGIERKLISRDDAVRRTLTVLRFLKSGKQSADADAMGYKGFYYHFIDMETGRRADMCELSSVDNSFLMAGLLTAAGYFSGDSKEESEIRDTVDFLYRRVEWDWMLNDKQAICLGWTPESGCLPYYWDTDYSESILLYILALGSPTHPIPPAIYARWTTTFKWKTLYDIGHLYAGPLFIHQLSHIWIDFRGIQDDFNRNHAIDYFENSRRATYVQQKYAIENKNGFAHYDRHCWGFTASDGPGPVTLTVNGIQRRFYGYVARGVPFGPDDGTFSPWCVAASLPFATTIVLDTIRFLVDKYDLIKRGRGFGASFNPTYPQKSPDADAWMSEWKYGLNQGPIVLMIENFQTGMIWDIARKNRYIIRGLQQAGFRGGWLDDVQG